MKKKTALIITGGAAPPLGFVQSYFNRCDFLVAADSGLEQALTYGVRPDLIVGDMDSLKDKTLLDDFPPEAVKAYPQDKDFTDTELALDEARDYDRRILVGGGEGRLDHTLALLALFGTERRPDLWISGREEIFLLDRSMELTGTAGETISFYPLGREKVAFLSEGLVWPLEPVRWDKGELSLSNRFKEGTVRLERRSGSLLVIRSLTDPQA
ncbi:MAG: thiamine diphosphokinase [Spirochaetales bacterium]|nr:thiamine diphosphokinase [Spirochaetales bacterium]